MRLQWLEAEASYVQIRNKKCILTLLSVKVIRQLQVLPKDVVDYPKFYCFKLSFHGLWKEKL